MIGARGRTAISPHERGQLWFSRYAAPMIYDAPPPADDWTGTVEYSLFGNDRVSCCTYAAIGHMIQQRCALLGVRCTLTTEQILAAYSGGTGYVPGRKETDNGGPMSAAIAYVQAHGLGEYRIDGGLRVNVHDPLELRAAAHCFGSVYVGANLPVRIESQGTRWKLPAIQTDDDIPGSLGGHAFLLTGYQRDSWWGMPWIDKTEIDNAWEGCCIDEGWVLFDDLWATSTRTAPNGFDLQRLRRDAAAWGP